MHRVGCAPDDARALADVDRRARRAALRGRVHAPRGRRRTRRRLHRRAARPLRRRPRRPRRARAPARRVVHAANSAGLLAHPEPRATTSCAPASRVYGVPPAAGLADRVPLRPALALKARVSHVKELAGRRRASPTACATSSTAPAAIATVPVGYADGVPRNLAHAGGEVLVGGRRSRSRAPSRWTSSWSTPATRRSRSATRSCSSGARATTRSPRTSGRTGSARSPTRSCAASARASRGGTWMSVGRSVAGRAGVVGRASPPGVAGAAYGAERPSSRGLRKPPDPDAGTARPARFDEDRRLPSHDGGSISRVSRGDGPAIVLVARRHAVDRASWVKQFEALPSGASASSRSTTAATATRRRDDAATRSTNLGRRRPHGARASRPARRGPRRALDGRDRGAGVRDPPPATSRASASRGIVLLSTLAAHAARAARAACVGSLEQVVGRGARPRRRSWAPEPRVRCSPGSGSGATRSRATSSSTRQMLAACAAETTARDASRAARPRPHRELPSRRPDARARWHRRRASPRPRVAPDRGAHPGRAARDVRGAGHMLMLERTDESTS